MHISGTTHLIDVGETQGANRMNEFKFLWLLVDIDRRQLFQETFLMMALLALYFRLGIHSLVLAGVAMEHQIFLVVDGDLLDWDRLAQAHPVDRHAAVDAVDQSVKHHKVPEFALLLVVGSKPHLVWELHDLERKLADLGLSAFRPDPLKLGVSVPNLSMLDLVHEVESADPDGHFRLLDGGGLLLGSFVRLVWLRIYRTE